MISKEKKKKKWICLARKVSNSWIIHNKSFTSLLNITNDDKVSRRKFSTKTTFYDIKIKYLKSSIYTIEIKDSRFFASISRQFAMWNHFQCEDIQEDSTADLTSYCCALHIGDTSNNNRGNKRERATDISRVTEERHHVSKMKESRWLFSCFCSAHRFPSSIRVSTTILQTTSVETLLLCSILSAQMCMYVCKIWYQEGWQERESEGKSVRGKGTDAACSRNQKSQRSRRDRHKGQTRQRNCIAR